MKDMIKANEITTTVENQTNIPSAWVSLKVPVIKLLSACLTNAYFTDIQALSLLCTEWPEVAERKFSRKFLDSIQDTDQRELMTVFAEQYGLRNQSPKHRLKVLRIAEHKRLASKISAAIGKKIKIKSTYVEATMKQIVKDNPSLFSGSTKGINHYQPDITVLTSDNELISVEVITTNALSVEKRKALKNAIQYQCYATTLQNDIIVNPVTDL